MNSTVNKQKLLEWLDVEIDLSAGSHEQLRADRWAFRHTKKEVESGRLDVDVLASHGLRVAIDAVLAERARQDNKWGEQNHDPQYWTGILGEEFGELCQAINETVFNNGPVEREKGGYANMRAEAVQVAAVAIAFVEMLDRRYGSKVL